MGGKTNTSTQTTTSGPPPQVAAAYNDLLSRAQQVASTPYQQYAGQLLAPFSGSQQAAFGTIDQAQGIAQPYINQATAYAQQGAAPITSDQISQYLNPYTQDVIKATQANFNEGNAQQQAQVRGNAIARGSLGGDRVGVAQGELARQQQLAQAPVIAGLNAQSYNTALSAAQQDAYRKAQAAYTFGNLGQEALGTTLTGANAQLASGALQQQQAQAGLNIPYQQWLQQQAFPYQQTGWLAGIETGVGSQMGGTSTATNQSPGPNPYAQWGGLGLAAAGLFLKDGGAVKGYADGGIATGNPWSGGAGWIPTAAMTRGAGLPRASAPVIQADNGTGQMVKNAMGLADQIRSGRSSGIAAPIDLSPSSTGIDLSNVNTFIGPTMGAVSLPPLYHRGGIVANGGAVLPNMGIGIRGYAFGGNPELNDLVYRGGASPPEIDDLVYRPSKNPVQFSLVNLSNAPVQEAGISPAARISDAFAVADKAVTDGTMDPQGANQGATTLGYSGPTVPLPRARPAEADVAMASGDDTTSIAPMAYAEERSPSLVAPAGISVGPVEQGPAMGPSQPSFADKLRSISPALISAGFGMMASRSPFLGTAIGEGGLAGVNAYNQMKSVEREEAQKQRQYGFQERNLDLQTKRLDQAAKEAADRLKLQTEQFIENQRQHRVPSGYREGANGLEFIPGGPNDPAIIERNEKAKRVSGLTDTAAEVAARQLLNGDMSPLTNYGRGAQGPDNINRIRGIATDILTNEMGMKPTEAAQHISGQIQKYRAAGIGQSAEARTAGTREANLNLILKATEAAIPAALEASKNVARTGWVPVNRIIQKGQVMASDPALREFGMANLQLAEHWARAMNPTGVMRESDRDLALEFLSTADSEPTYERVVKQLEKQIRRERDAIAGTRGTGTTEQSPKVGDRKQFKQGWGVWNGSTYVPEARP